MPRGESTVTWYPCSRRASASFQTRLSNGTGRFSTMMRTRLFLSFISVSRSDGLIEPGQCAKHRCLSPVQCRSLVHYVVRVAPVVEVARAVLHVLDRPLRNLRSQPQAVRIDALDKHLCFVR